LLQAGVALACVVPIYGGVLGIVGGAGMMGHGGDVTLDSHIRYLSGLLLGLGLGFASTIPAIEKATSLFTVLSAIVVIGGLSRAYGVVVNGWPAGAMVFALAMELGVVPFLLLWQRHVAGRSG